MIGVGFNLPKDLYFEELEKLKRSYQQIQQQRDRKSDQSDLEIRLHEILAFFCQCAQLEKSVIASQRIEESYISGLRKQWHFILCRLICNDADKFRSKQFSRLLEIMTRRTTKEELLQEMLQRGVRAEDIYYKESTALLNKFGGHIGIKIIIHMHNQVLLQETIVTVHETIWNYENPFRDYSYTFRVDDEFLDLFGVIERCLNLWITFLQRHTLIPASYTI